MEECKHIWKLVREGYGYVLVQCTECKTVEEITDVEEIARRLKCQ